MKSHREGSMTDREERQLVRVLMQRFLDGTLLSDVEIVEAEEIDPESERWLEGSLLTGLLEETDAVDRDPEWQALIENLRAEEAPEDLKAIVGRIDERVRVLRPAS
jgi:hypothetical protein